jgi:ribosomal RNA-processing protein 12
MNNSRGDSKKKGKKSKVDSETRLRIDDEDPLDLLDGTISKLSSKSEPMPLDNLSNELYPEGGAKRRKPGFEATKFKTDEDTGKMIIADSDSDVGANTSKLSTKPSVNDALAGAAYRETLVSVDGFTRNPNGTIKFHKDTKKRRKEEMEMEMDVDVDDATGKKHAAGPHRTPKKKPARVGQEFKAKVCFSRLCKPKLDTYSLFRKLEAM